MPYEQSNYFYLGIAVSYVSVTIIQITLPGPLSMFVYFTVAALSLELTLFEVMKKCIFLLIEGYETIYRIYDMGYQELLSLYTAYQGLPGFDEDVQECKKTMEQLKQEGEKKNYRKRIPYLRKIYSVTLAIQIIVCIMQLVITPLKAIPYDAATSKFVNVASLFSFLFFSLFMDNQISDLREKTDSELARKNQFIKRHVDIISKIKDSLVVKPVE